MPLDETQTLAQQAQQAWTAADWPRAAELLERLVRGHPDKARAGDWFDTALAYKFAGDWKKAYELGKAAVLMVPRGQAEAAFWNLGIAATVLRDWETARDAWQGYGIELSEGNGEIVEDFGLTAVRIEHEGGQEVVWARRLCPTRARIVSVPFHPSRRFGEVVVHDGAPNGERIVDEQRIPVFDELLIFEPSELVTQSVRVHAPSYDDLEALLESFQVLDYGAEAQDSGVVYCKCCSEGTQTTERDRSAGDKIVLLAAPQDKVPPLLDAWVSADPDNRQWSALHVMAVG